MRIYHPQTAEEAVRLRQEYLDTAVYFAGGTDDLRLGGAAEGKDLIDLNALGFDTIEKKNGKLYIGSRVTLQQLTESDLVPEFLKEAAGFCASFVKRNAATVGGNLALRRDDSYLAAAVCAAEAELCVRNTQEEKTVKAYDYLTGTCTCFIEYLILDADRSGWVKRFGNTSGSHATLIGAVSNGIYALSVHGSGLACGTSPDICETLNFTDDLTGGAAYKQYLAKTVFELRR